MSRVNLLMVGLVALLTFQPVHADDDDDDWKGYQNRIQQGRQESEKRYQNWNRDQDKRYQSWREAPGTDQDRVLELPDSGLQPGRYTIRLPFGLGVRINAAEDPRRTPGPAAWGDRSYGDVYYRARQINGQLRDLHLELQRGGNAELTAEAAKIYEQGAGLANAAATRRPAEEIRAHFAKFDQLWHPFSHRLARQTQLGPSVQQRVAAVDQLENGLHQILAIAPAPPYDRPLVAALTSELVQTTSHLLEDLKVEPQTLELQAITLRAQRVKQNAADLNATVRQNAPFATIVEEYEEFDRGWHRLHEQARVSPELDAHVRKIARQVRQIDLQLHQELYVNVPIVDNRQQLQQLSAGIAKSAEHLADDLDADAGRDKAELVYEARLFAWHAREVNRVLTDRQPAQAEQKAFAELLASWQRLDAQIGALRGDRFEHSQAIAAQLATDLQRLQTQWRG